MYLLMGRCSFGSKPGNLPFCPIFTWSPGQRLRHYYLFKMLRKLFLGTLCVLVTAYTSAQTKVDKQVNLEEVVVTGTGTEHTLKDAPVQTEVISAKTLRNFAGKSIEEILGMLTASFDFNEGDMGSKIQMNGLGNSYILILIDGKRIHGDNGGENDLSLIDPQNIEKIEVVKGAASALYGSDAIAGVINIITRNRHTEGLGSA